MSLHEQDPIGGPYALKALSHPSGIQHGRRLPRAMLGLEVTYTSLYPHVSFTTGVVIDGHGLDGCASSTFKKNTCVSLSILVQKVTHTLTR